MRKIDKDEQDKRRNEVLATSAPIAEKIGLMNIRRENVAEKLDIAEGLVARSFGSMHKLRIALVGYAISNGVLSIVAEALASKDADIRKAALKAPDELKRRAVESLI